MTRLWQSRAGRSALAVRTLLLCLVTLLGFNAHASSAELKFPALSGRIVDGAGIVSPESGARIRTKLGAHEAKTSDQVVIATVPSLQGTTIEDFANRLYRHWGLGQKDKNNGVLLLVAPVERKVRIEVGYGLEGALTDAMSRIIITTAIAPRFKAGDFGGGIEAGVDAILNILTGDAEEWQRRAKVRNDDEPGATDYLALAFFLLILVMILMQVFRNGQRGGGRMHRTRNGTWITIPSGGGWSGSSGGGWSGGGGGFSGGGGSSGGGGASGDW